MSKGSTTVFVARTKDDDNESLIRRFLRLWKNENVIQEVMERKEYRKPSVKRRMKKERARRRKKAEDRKRSKSDF